MTDRKSSSGHQGWQARAAAKPSADERDTDRVPASESETAAPACARHVVSRRRICFIEARW